MKNTALILVFLSIPMLTGCKKAPILKAAKATKTHVETTITTTSSGTVDAEQQAALGFTAAGRVSKILVRVGDHVRPGQVLATLD
ncbi:MAG: biotin/lipoyl-binding protein, partial [Bdellovibrionota bacterium]